MAETKAQRSVDMRAIHALNRPPRRRGCLTSALLLGAAGTGLLAAVYFLASVSLSAAEQGCAAVPVGMPRADAEALLERDIGAEFHGAGGLTGLPPSVVEMGHRGEFVSWSCELGLDDEANVMETHFRSWVVPRVGTRTPTIPGLPGMGLPSMDIPTRAPSSIPDLDDPNLPPEIRAALSPGED